MQDVHLGAFDLNLLRAFDALWVERNVTRAARRVGLTQSALSHALGRLREQLDDPLFRPSPTGMVPTARAQALARPVGEALRLFGRAVARPEAFDPRALERTFTLATSDYGELVFLPRLVARLEREAPGVSLVVRPHELHLERELVSGAHDLVLTPARSAAPGIREEVLLDERFVCVLRKGHPLAKKRLTLARFLALRHVLIAPLNVGEAPVDATLRAIGRTRRVTVRVPHFLSAPMVVAGSDHVITLPARVVAALGASRFAVHAPPVPVGGFSVRQLWHERNDADPGHQWLRRVVAEVASVV
jgi:DNA-binding transcriptional LysR family regulator